MTLPAHVREAALAAGATRAPDVRIAHVVHDSDVDGPLPSFASDGDRCLLFEATDLLVAVVVQRAGALLHLHVDAVPVADLEVELLQVEPRPRLVVRGAPPLQLSAIAGGPASLGLTERTAGRLRCWQTAWLSL